MLPYAPYLLPWLSLLLLVPVPVGEVDDVPLPGDVLVVDDREVVVDPGASVRVIVGVATAAAKLLAADLTSRSQGLVSTSPAPSISGHPVRFFWTSTARAGSGHP